MPPLKLVHSFCAFKADDGPCKAMLKRFFFNVHTQHCEEFVYGGCEGNQNRFESLEECQEKCASGRFWGHISQAPGGLSDLIIDLIILEKRISANHFNIPRIFFTLFHIFSIRVQILFLLFFHISHYQI